MNLGMVSRVSRPSRQGARLVCAALAVEIAGAVALTCLLGTARAAKMAGWDRAARAWNDLGEQITPARRLARPRSLHSDDLRPGLTREQLARLLGGAGAPVLPGGWHEAPIRCRETTYRWSFNDGSDLTATFEGGRLVIFSLSERGPG